MEETILSVLKQDYPNLEYIVVDGGSSDNSLEIIKKYSKNLSFWVSEKDRGQSHAINKGLERTTGEIINWLNSDDLLIPGALKAVGEEFATATKPEILFGDFKVINKFGNILFSRKTPTFCYRQLLYGRQLSCQPAVFFSRNLLSKIGYLNETLAFCMDIDFWIRAARSKCSFRQIKKYLALIRVHGDTKTAKLNRILQKEHKSLVKRCCGPGITDGTLFEDYHFSALNILWRGIAAANRLIYRGDFTVCRMRKEIKKVII